MYDVSGFSGGLVVVLVVGLMLFVIGSDIGGSICILVSVCGVVGVKLFSGRILMVGFYGWVDWCFVGLFVCMVADCAFVVDVVSGHYFGDHFSLREFICIGVLSLLVEG